MNWYDIGMKAAELAGNQAITAQQFERQKKLMDLQVRNQQKLNTQGQALQMETWQQTNYPAQVEMLKQAGLNPSLLYSKGGAGGTTGGQGGGSASGGTAPQGMPMNITNILEMKQLRAMTNAQEAQARKANAEATVIEKYGSGKSQAEITATEAQAGKAGAEQKLAEVNSRLAEIEESYKPQLIESNVRSVIAMANKLEIENSITTETKQSIIERAKAEAVGATIENELNQSKTKLTESEIKAIQTGIVQKWTELSQKGRSLNIDQFEAEIKAEYPNAGQVIGAIAKKAYKTLKNVENWLKGSTEPIKDTVK